MTKLKWENQIVCGRNPEALRQMPSEIISCVMTSFPYWGQRDYKVTGQMGLEKHYSEWLEKAWLVMDEIWRVLRLDGTCWINLGDKYGGSGGDHKPYHNNEAGFQGKLMRGTRATNLMDKSLLFIPERFAIGCLDRDWTIPNKNIWHKPNPMPSSGKGRFTNTWEYLYFMVKNTKLLFFINTATRKTLEKKPPKHKQQINRDWKWKDETKKKRITLWRSEDYFFDLDAVRRPHKTDFDKLVASGGASKKYDGEDKLLVCRERVKPNPAGKNPGDVITTKIQEEDAEKMGSPRARQWRQREKESVEFFNPRGSGGNPDAPFDSHPAGANPGDFWSIPTQPSKLKHYASYPERLCETPLKAGCPRWICEKCGMARVRVTKQEKPPFKDTRTPGEHTPTGNGKISGPKMQKWLNEHPSTTLGWSFCSCLCPACGEADCKCGEKWRPGIVLDPFVGIGTTLIVAKKLGLWYHGIDLKPEYCEMSEKRLKDVKYQEVFDYD